jgi:gamma-glutamyltranspeptidase / glutathione hydrolase
MRSHCKLFILLLLMSSGAHGEQIAAVQPVHAPHAMVASMHALASSAGVEIMRAGGNAVDAAVAVGFALAVVHPQAGNLGGGGFMLIRFSDGKTHFIDYREKAPAAATANMYLDSQGSLIPDASTVGYKAIAVPGSVAGMVFAGKKYGRLSLGQVMAPAIKLAQEGFPLATQDADNLRGDHHLGDFPESRRVFLRDGDYFKAGETFRQPDLARTLKRIADNPDDFYHGALARELAVSVQKGGGLITVDDLAQYEVKEREAVRGSYRGYEIVSAPPPSSGGITLIEILNILEGYNLAKLGRSTPSVHLTLEAFRRAFFDRAELLGDPDFAKIPVAQLIDKKYGAAWRESIDPAHVSHSKELQRPAVFTELEQYASVHPRAAGPEPEHTTHYSIVDQAGNAVAVTTTLDAWFGSRVTAEGLGFLLNDEMDDFSAQPGVPNTFELIQGPANAIGPGKRPLSAMAPTIVLKDGKLFLVLGSRGGPRIITTVANVLMGVVDYGMNLQQAVNAPRFHHQWLPDVTRVEQDFSSASARRLKAMGHKLEPATEETRAQARHWSDAECIALDQKTGERLGASDKRNQGKAVGF